MTALLPSVSRRSRFLFDFNAEACLAAPEQSLDAITGQAATFSRASTKRAYDTNGVSRIVPHSLPAFHWATDPTSGLSVPGVLLESSGVNLALQSEDWSTTWAAVGTPTRVAASDTASGVSLDTIGDDAAGTLEGYSQTVTFTGNAVKAISVRVKQGTSTSSVIRLRDTTASADRLLATITWTGTVPTVTMTTGTYIGAVICYGGVYRLLFATTSVTAANTNSLQFYPATNAALTVASTGTIIAGGVQAENAITPSSYVKTTTGTATRSADALTFAQNLTPRALTLYLRFVDFSALDGATAMLASIGAPTGNGTIGIYRDGAGYTAIRWGTTIAVASVALTPSAANVYEARVAVAADGSLTFGLSINAATETTATSASTRTLDPSFSANTLYVGREAVVGGVESLLIQQVRIAAGVQTLAIMRGTGGVVNNNPIVP